MAAAEIAAPTLRTRVRGVRTNPWARFVVRRLLGLALMICGLVAVVFLAVRLVPGDPAFVVGGTDSTAIERAQIRHELGIDRPIEEQFVTYVTNLIHGNLGATFRTKQPIRKVVESRIGSSLKLAFGGLALVLLVSIPGGLLAGALTSESRHSKFEVVFTASTSVVGSIPDFLAATFLAFIFGVWLRILPVAADQSWRGTILPVFAVSLASTAFLMRIVRRETLNVLAMDYTRTARSKRLPTRRIYFRHVLPNVVTASFSVSGLVFANIIGGAVIVENVFARPGLGTALVASVLQHDYPTTQGLILVLGVIVVVVNAIVDIGSALLDPRSLVRQA